MNKLRPLGRKQRPHTGNFRFVMMMRNHVVWRWNDVVVMKPDALTSIPICSIPAETKASAARMPPTNIFCSGAKSGKSGQAPPGHTGIITSTIAGFITWSWSGIKVIPNTSLRSRDAWNVHREPCYIRMMQITRRSTDNRNRFQLSNSHCVTVQTQWKFYNILMQ